MGVLESKWDPIHKKLVRRLLEEQDKVLRSYFAQKGGKERGEGGRERGREGGREKLIDNEQVTEDREVQRETGEGRSISQQERGREKESEKE